ncbi:PAS domain-containing protein [Mastigocoleus testarum]|uniref:histidine kinase n=1 Tax=Mastigocoleus testarum BC008 TaxID=371196 RepID=A0A0V7ZZV9_9CYAN|nr:PAS domain-containing protein [Mastigocoleus testarum]KST70014.1 hypothetical protein BC008_06130 [Mastigocoleus testarum BC008]
MDNPVPRDREHLQLAYIFVAMSQEWQTALQAFLSANGLGFWKWNLTTNQIECDSECQRILGYDIGEVTNLDKFWKQIIHSQDLPRARKVLQDYLEKRIPIYKVKLRILTKFGQWKWILATAQIHQRDLNQKPVILVGTYKDITSEVSAKLAKKKQSKREKFFQELQAQIIAGNSLERILEFAVGELQHCLQVDKTVIYRPQADGSSSVVFESLANSLSSLKSRNISTHTSDCVGDQASIAKQQVIRKYIDSQTVDPQQQGKFFFKNEALHDRSDSDRSRTELLAPILVPSDQIQALSFTSHQQQFAIGQVGALSLLHTDYSPGEYPSSHKVSHYCWGMLAVQQYDRDREWENWEIDTLKQLTKLIAIAIRQQEQIAQFKRETAVRKSLEAKLNSQSQQLQINLQEISKLQEQLLESQKMSNLGQLTTDMLLEINKPADFIYKSLESASQYAQDLIEFLENYQSHPDRVQHFSTSNIQYLNLESVKTDFPNLLWSMGAGSERIKNIVGNLQIFLNNQEQIEKIDIHQEIDRTLQLLQYRLKEQPTRSGIQVIKNFGDLPPVEACRGEIAQVLINLIANAIDALEERMQQDYSFIPTIWVNTSSIANHLSLVERDRTETLGGKSLRKSKVIINITDNGKGILPHIQRQIFEPLFTTKSASKTKGLGLSICQQIIVHKHRGKLKCNSRLGEGSEFVIEINAKYPNLSYAMKNANFLNF